MNGKMEMLILMLVLIGGKSRGKPHKMEDAANQEKEEPCGDDGDCPGNQSLTAKHLHGDQEETGGAFRRLREELDSNFDENSGDQEAATHHLHLNKNEEAVNMDSRVDYNSEDEDCLIDDEDCDKYDGDDNDDGASDDDDREDRERRIGKENGDRNSSFELFQPKSVKRIVPDNINKADYIYF